MWDFSSHGSCLWFGLMNHLASNCVCCIGKVVTFCRRGLCALFQEVRMFKLWGI